MATGALLNAVTTNTTGTGVQITGDFEALAQGTHYAGGVLELQVADTDTDGDYRPVGREGQWLGPGTPATIRNNGTKYYRGVLKGVQSSMGTPSCTLKYWQ